MKRIFAVGSRFALVDVARWNKTKRSGLDDTRIDNLWKTLVEAASDSVAGADEASRIQDTVLGTWDKPQDNENDGASTRSHKLRGTSAKAESHTLSASENAEEASWLTIRW